MKKKPKAAEPQPLTLEQKIDNYRRQRKLETGKMLTRETARCELLEKALAGQPDVPPVADVMTRIAALEENFKQAYGPAELPARPKASGLWLACCDQLPAVADHYICCLDTTSTGYCEIRACWWDGSGWYYPGSAGNSRINAVCRFWLPLPPGSGPSIVIGTSTALVPASRGKKGLKGCT